MFRASGYYFMALLGAAVAAFCPKYIARPAQEIDAYTHVHAAAMVAWCGLLIAQPFFIRARRLSAHRRLGTLSYGVAPAVVVTSVLLAWRPSDPIRVGRGSAYMDIGLVGTFAAGGSTADDIEGGTQLGGHDPNQNGFTIQGVELNLQGAIDPYFRGNANVLFSVDAEGESFLELEEAWLETISLPSNFQVRAGQYLTEFGRLNTQHPHTWSFVDTPLVNARFLGPDGCGIRERVCRGWPRRRSTRNCS